MNGGASRVDTAAICDKDKGKDRMLQKVAFDQGIHCSPTEYSIKI